MRRSQMPTPVTAAFDRGPAKYFHGRKRVLRDFSKLVERAAQSDSGTTFLIQGASWAGKTALLSECERLTHNSKWKTAHIYPEALWAPAALRKFLGLKNVPEFTGGRWNLA